MNEFDKKVKELSRKVDVPKDYSKKVEKLLNELPDQETSSRRKPSFFTKPKIVFAVIAFVMILCFASIHSVQADASILDFFKQTIMEMFHLSDKEEQEELGVTSQKEAVQSKPDLLIEMKESVVDENGIYLLIKIKAPADITFSKEITFDYFAFCEGSNYNADKLIGGATDCSLFEVGKKNSNEAIYVMSITADMAPYMDKEVTAYFKDLTWEPNGTHPKCLVEGMWSVTFPLELTVKKSIKMDGNDTMTFPYMDTSAKVDKIKLTPLGMALISDISSAPFEDLGVSDTSISIRLKMVDGSEIYITSEPPEGKWIVDSGNSEFYQKKGKNYQKDTYSFKEVIPIANVVGFYIQDVYIPVE